VRDGFLAIGGNEDPKRIMVVDAENSFDAVWQQIEDVCKRALNSSRALSRRPK